ncbi:MAG TPA: class I SAM-dependent methyltransferase [Bryobacteraceae bacterium]|nr:class I SAM-dependent methyltransferase [Bryobacteraceae bacterium]
METSYDEIRYPGAPLEPTHPSRLAALATLFGMEPAPVERCRVLELGCGDGSNLLPMAADLPEARFVGFDLARTAIDAGNRAASELGVTNLRLEHASILDLDPALGLFDYIIAHGVYSWVAPEVQDKLLAIAGGNLAPQGVAYISYNALPGCRIRQMLREILLFHTCHSADAGERIAKAREMLNVLMLAPESSESVIPALLKEEAADMLRRAPYLLFHDVLAEEWHPVHFTEFIAHASRHGLQYLAEANAHDMEPRRFSRELRDALNSHSQTRLDREQYMDFLKCRRFRRTLLCRRELPLSEDDMAGRVRTLYISSSAVINPPQPDLTGPATVEFQGLRGAALSTSHPLAKTAMAHLTGIWPEAAHFDRLREHCGSILGSPADAALLARILLGGFKTGLVQLRTHPPRCVSRPGSHPAAPALARWQAANGSTLTSQRHTAVEITNEDRAILRLLDGIRDLRAVAGEAAQATTDTAAAIARLAHLGLLIS